MKVELKNVDVMAYTDEKWLEFILNQIIINSIKLCHCLHSNVPDLWFSIDLENGIFSILLHVCYLGTCIHVTDPL